MPVYRSSPCLKWCPTAGASLFRIISPVISGNRLLGEHLFQENSSGYSSNLSKYKNIKVRRILFVRIVQQLCESRGGRPGLSVLMSLLVSVDVKNY